MVTMLCVILVYFIFNGDGSLELTNDQIDKVLPEAYSRMVDQCTIMCMHEIESLDNVERSDLFDTVKGELMVEFFKTLDIESKMRLRAVIEKLSFDNYNDDIIMPGRHEVGQRLLLKMGEFLQEHREMRELHYYSRYNSDINQAQRVKLTEEQLIGELLGLTEIGMRVADIENLRKLEEILTNETELSNFQEIWAKVEKEIEIENKGGENGEVEDNPFRTSLETLWAEQLMGTDLDFSSDESSNSEAEIEGQTEEGLTVEGLTQEELTNRIANFINRNRNDEDVLDAESEAEFASMLEVEANLQQQENKFLSEGGRQDNAYFEDEFMSSVVESIEGETPLDFESYIDNNVYRQLVNSAVQNLNRDFSEVLEDRSDRDLDEVTVLERPDRNLREAIILESGGEVLRTERNEDNFIFPIGNINLGLEEEEEVIQRNTLDNTYFLGLIPSLKLSYTIILGGVFISSLVISMYLYIYYKKTIVSFLKNLINFFY